MVVDNKIPFTVALWYKTVDGGYQHTIKTFVPLYERGAKILGILGFFFRDLGIFIGILGFLFRDLENLFQNIGIYFGIFGFLWDMDKDLCV